MSEQERLSKRLAAFSTLLSNARLASEPQGVIREDLYRVNKLMREVASGLADESRRLSAALPPA